MHNGRERKTKPNKEKKDRAGLRQRKKGGADPDEVGWSSALDPELQYGASKHARKGRDKKNKKSGRNQADERAFEDVDLGISSNHGGFEPYFQPPEPWPASRPGGMLNIHKATDRLFVSWAELLRSREALKSRIDNIAAVHGWEGASQQKSFLGGIEPGALLDSIQAEIAALDPAADALDGMSLMLELQNVRKQLEIVGDERDRMAEDLHQSLEDCFEARDQLAGQSTELEMLRQEALSVAKLKAAENEGSNRADSGDTTTTAADTARLSVCDPLAMFKSTLSRGQVAEGRRVVHALEKLKLPDESIMSQRELACWHENKKTITNSLKTLSSQIYSATTRILYEIIQNADDCSFENHNDDVEGQPTAVRELYLECSDDALVAFHNENGFQPKDLYAMCQVGESSKVPGSGKIGRKGIGFKSVFQICDRPVVLSPPFQFCFDTIAHEVFGYIVPSWVDNPRDHVPARQHKHLERIYPGGPAIPSATGTLLVCPMAPRVQGLDLMRDLNFDGLSLAFLKNLEKISFVSSVSRGQGRHTEPFSALSADSTAVSDQREVVYTLEETEQDVGDISVASGVLKGVTVMSHKLSQVTIIERREAAVTSHRYRLHSYVIQKYKSASVKGDGIGGAAPTAGTEPATTTISLAFPVDDKLAPLRSTDGELIFAYLPVTAAGFGFAINADFELVASRQDVNDSHSGNHVLLGRVPPLFVHAILTDPCLGEDAFATYLPDVESIRKDRSGGGRKWHTLASALHRETGAWMMIPTEDVPERVKRKHVVLRPKHLSETLVPNSLLKEVTRISEMGEVNFAHADAVTDMALENCIDYCPVRVVLDCIRTILHPVDEEFDGECADDLKSSKVLKSKQQGRKRRGKRVNLWPRDCDGDFADYARRHHKPARASPTISEEQLLNIWHYLTAECKACVAQGEAGQSRLRLILDAVIGPRRTSQQDGEQDNVESLRIFPVQGSSQLRMHSELGVPLCIGLCSSLSTQGPDVLRLAEQVVPLLDTDRLQGIEYLTEMMGILRIELATEIELEQQLRNCFRFGLATTADPQLWWDSFKYAVSKGNPHGLVDFMPDAAIALPLADSPGSVVSSRDLQRFSVGLPCLLGLRRKPSRGDKFLLAIPPSASSWGSRVRWELAMVQAFGLTYPRSDIERLQMGAFGTDLLLAVTEARKTGSIGTLQALSELIDIYKSRMSSLLPLLRSVLQKSCRPEEWLLEERAEIQPFASSCSPKFVDEVLDFCTVTPPDECFHTIRDLLETSLGMLRLRSPDAMNRDQASADAVDDVERVAENDECSDDSFVSAEDEEPLEVVDDVAFWDDDDSRDCDHGASDEAMWEVLERLLGFHHTFEPQECPWLLYSVLTPALVEAHKDTAWDEPRVPTLSSLASSITHFIRQLEIGTIIGCSSANENCPLDDLWSKVCNAGGMWLGGDFVSLERCVWKSTGGPLWDALVECGCALGRVVAIESVLVDCLDSEHIASGGIETDGQERFLAAIGNFCINGSARRQGSTWSPGLTSPALPHPTCLEMMLDSTLPMLLERESSKRPENVDGCVVEHKWSHSTHSCYEAVVATLDKSGFPRGQRWMVPVPSISLGTCQLVVDRRLNRQLSRDSAGLLIFPDDRDSPTVTQFVLRHFGEHCLHPTMVPIFACVAERQSVGFESPRARVQRTFSRSLRLAVADASTACPCTPAAAAAAAAASRAEGRAYGSDQLWSFISEVYGRSVASEEFGEVNQALPPGLSEADNWELLMWAAITCANQYCLSQVATSNPQHAFRYQETLRRVRQFIPFVRVGAGREVWSFLAGSHDETNADTDDTARGVLMLRTLFGFELWGNLTGVELLGRAPTYTADVPSSILYTCASQRTQQVNSDASGLLEAHFPEDLQRQTLILVWEWFLLEVAGAAPPNVLWSTLHEPIVSSTRSRIRQAEAELRSASADGPCSTLLDNIYGHTHVDELMDEMDAVDEARAAAAAREAEARRREREVAQARRRAETEALRRQRELERQEAEQRRREEREQRRARRTAQDTTEDAARSLHQSQPEPQQHGRSRTRAFSPSQAASQGLGGALDRGPEQNPEPAPEVELPHTVREMRNMIRAQQAEIDRMRSQLQTTIRVPVDVATAAAPHADGVPQGLGFGRMADSLVRMLSGGGDAPPVRRHVDGQTMRESEVKGKLARFLAGMRAYERQRTDDVSAGSSQQPLPPVLSEFIAWAGDVLAGEQQHRAGDIDRHQRSAGGSSAEDVARRYVGAATNTASSRNGNEDQDESCCICLEALHDSANFDRLGEPLETACGHRFHAVCYAKTMESTQQDPWCPICRSDTFGTSARFL